MPYLKKDRREELDAGTVAAANGGDLNYLLATTILTGKLIPKVVFTNIFNAFWARSEQRYEVINTIGGAAMNCALEFQRRAKLNPYRANMRAMGEAYIEWYGAVAGPYENTKIAENGDIFP